MTHAISGAACCSAVSLLALASYTLPAYARGSIVDDQQSKQEPPSALSTAASEKTAASMLLAFSTESFLQQDQVHQASDVVKKDPINKAFVRMSDGNLLAMRVDTDGTLVFSKTASGYAEKGYKLKVAGIGTSIDFPAADVFVPLKPLQALAYFKDDWKAIVDTVKARHSEGVTAIDPKLVENTLRPLTPIEGETRTASQIINETDARLLTLGIKLPAFKDDPIPTDIWGNYLSEPVYLPIEGTDLILLQIQQRGDQIEFSKNSSGYAVFGIEISAVMVDAGFELSTAELFFPLEIEKAIGLMDGDIDRMVNKAKAQATAIKYSVDPDLLRKTLEGFKKPVSLTPSDRADSKK